MSTVIGSTTKHVVCHNTLQLLPPKYSTFKIDKTRKLGHHIQLLWIQMLQKYNIKQNGVVWRNLIVRLNCHVLQYECIFTFITDDPWLIELQERVCQNESINLVSCLVSCLVTKIKILAIILLENRHKIFLWCKCKSPRRQKVGFIKLLTLLAIWK